MCNNKISDINKVNIGILNFWSEFGLSQLKNPLN